MERKTLSAHELNKFSYCPYQWYYEKMYGRKELRRLYQERNELLSLEDAISSNFVKGERYHSDHYARVQFRVLVMKLIGVLFVAGSIVGYFVMQYGVD